MTNIGKPISNFTTSLQQVDKQLESIKTKVENRKEKTLSSQEIKKIISSFELCNNATRGLEERDIDNSLSDQDQVCKRILDTINFFQQNARAQKRVGPLIVSLFNQSLENFKKNLSPATKRKKVKVEKVAKSSKNSKF